MLDSVRRWCAGPRPAPERGRVASCASIHRARPPDGAPHSASSKRFRPRSGFARTGILLMQAGGLRTSAAPLSHLRPVARPPEPVNAIGQEACGPALHCIPVRRGCSKPSESSGPSLQRQLKRGAARANAPFVAHGSSHADRANRVKCGAASWKAAVHRALCDLVRKRGRAGPLWAHRHSAEHRGCSDCAPSEVA